MKQVLKIVLGLALIAAGVLWILNLTGVISFEFSTKGWWALFVIVPCIFGLFSDTDKVGSCLGIGIGVLLFLAARDVITWNQMWQIGLALVVISIGVRLLFFKESWCHKTVCEQETVSREGKDIRVIDTSFGKQSLSFAGEKFEGADVKSSFGGLVLDLTGADIADGAFIDLNVGFAGVAIIVPEGVAVKISVNSGFGGVQDNRRNKAETNCSATLIITGKVGFGGVEIKN